MIVLSTFAFFAVISHLEDGNDAERCHKDKCVQEELGYSNKCSGKYTRQELLFPKETPLIYNKNCVCRVTGDEGGDLQTRGG